LDVGDDCGTQVVCFGQLATVQPGGSVNLYAYQVDFYNNPIPNGTVYLSNGYHLYSGGHNHNEGHTTQFVGHISSGGGSYSGYDGIPFTFTGSTIGELEFVSACYYYCTYSDILVSAAVSQYFGDSTNVFVGATGIHPTNHAGSALMNRVLTLITRQYDLEYNCVQDYKIVGVNDMALPNGGTFDLGVYWPVLNPLALPWIPPHLAHERGNSVDITARGPRGSIYIPHSVIYTNKVINRFVAICVANGLGGSFREAQGTDNEHIHCTTNPSGT